jgi:Family of unknown function (DUF5709)
MPDDETYDQPAGGYDDEVYQQSPDPSADPYDDGVLDASDTLEGDPGDDPLDTAIAPPDRWSAGEGFGTTLSEQRRGESLDQLLAEEEPDIDPYAGDEPRQAPMRTGAADARSEQEEDEPALFDDVEDPRAGRLVAEDEGAHPDTEPDLVARDAGIDAGGAGAEEAAVHVVDTGEPDSNTR